jgi:GT2 family glycosyltransferase
MARPAIIIVAYRAGENARRCIEAVQVDAPDATVYLVDNESYPHQLEPILRDFPAIVGIPLAENLGFGAAANRGIQRAFDEGATHALLLNDDVYLRTGCVAALVEAAGEGGATSPWLAGDGDAAYRGGKIDWDKGYAGHQEGATDYLIGGCMMISRPAWERTGWFDESFFLYCEDVDWCLRARAVGVPLVVVATELADHDGGASTGAGHSATWGYWWSRNRIKLVRKHRQGSATKTAARQIGSVASNLRSSDRDLGLAAARLRGIARGLFS